MKYIQYDVFNDLSYIQYPTRITNANAFTSTFPQICPELLGVYMRSDRGFCSIIITDDSPFWNISIFRNIRPIVLRQYNSRSIEFIFFQTIIDIYKYKYEI